MKVLLVSDNSRVSVQVGAALAGDPDIDVFEVATPQRALAQLDEAPYDLVIADADTVPTGGFALSRDIKARGQMGERMPRVILLLAREQDRFLSNWSQADAYMLKPVDPFDLAETARAVAAGRALPALPGVGGSPTPSLLDRPEASASVADADAEHATSG
ncbi:MAG TPA: response regulator [Egibacteraceae bacterium]|nr:response regulator [Egibacteraceae bacterium]